MAPIAPHEHQEVRLVLGGKKPLGSIEKQKDPLGYAIAVSLIHTGLLRGFISPTEDDCTGEATFVAPQNKALLERFKWLLEHGVENLGLKQFHREMGRLYGYTEQDIEDFISANIHCECIKCRGK
jgi:hypothetical protein